MDASVGQDTRTPAAPDPFDPFDPMLAVDPHPILKRLRESDPVRCEAAIGQWVVTGYDEGMSVLTHPDGDHGFVEMQKIRMGGDVEQQPYCQGMREWVLMKGGPDHRRIRSALARHFTRSRVARMREGLLIDAHALIDRFADAGTVDLVRGFAKPLPLATIGRLLDVPVADQQRIEKLVDGFIVAAQHLPMTPEELEIANGSIGGLADYFSELIVERRRHPGTDLLTVMIAEADAGALSHEELVANAWGLYAAGHETSAHAICDSVILLISHPDQLQLLHSDWSLLDNAVDEMLRFDGPSVATVRFFPEPIDVGAHVIPAQMPAVVYLSGPSRDPARWENPDRFDITRDRAKDHFAFGQGPHSCIGQHLARATLAVAVETLFTRLDGIRIDGEVDWADRTIFHGPMQLPIAWDRAAKRG